MLKSNVNNRIEFDRRKNDHEYWLALVSHLSFVCEIIILTSVIILYLYATTREINEL